jgi:hypothetical protein
VASGRGGVNHRLGCAQSVPKRFKVQQPDQESETDANAPVVVWRIPFELSDPPK